MAYGSASWNWASPVSAGTSPGSPSPRCPRQGSGPPAPPGGGAQAAGAAAVARGVLGGQGDGLLRQVVVDGAAPPRQGEDQQDDGQGALGPQPGRAADGGFVGEVEAAALRGQLEALGPAVDGGLLQGRAVECGPPAVVGAVRDAQHPARAARRDLGVGLDGSRGDGQGLRGRLGALVGAGDDDGPGHLPVDAPQGAAVALAEPAEAGGGVEDAAHGAGARRRGPGRSGWRSR